jgi:hypothetical protein
MLGRDFQPRPARQGAQGALLQMGLRLPINVTTMGNLSSRMQGESSEATDGLEEVPRTITS